MHNMAWLSRGELDDTDSKQNHLLQTELISELEDYIAWSGGGQLKETPFSKGMFRKV